MQTAIHYPTIKMALINMIPKSMRNVLEEHGALTHDKVSRRIAAGKGRHDLLEGLLMKEEELVSPGTFPSVGKTQAYQDEPHSN